MHCPIIKNYETEIRQYCAKNKLSYEKIISASLSWGEEDVFVLHNDKDPAKERLGLADKSQMPVILEVYVENGKLRFEQTEHTHKYLGTA
jgi:hypothetical protein